jgi:hypothetical protein
MSYPEKPVWKRAVPLSGEIFTLPEEPSVKSGNDVAAELIQHCKLQVMLSEKTETWFILVSASDQLSPPRTTKCPNDFPGPTS